MEQIKESTPTAVDPTRIISGVDFGTTNTGLAYSDTDSVSRNSGHEQANSIKVIKRFPGHGREVCKVPSRVAYRSENLEARNLPANNRQIFWGHEVQPGWIQYTWFKLRLDQDSRVTGFDDKSLKELSTSNEGIMQLPPGKGPRTVCEDYLVGPCSLLMEKLRGEYGTVLDETPIDFFVTVPAIWGDVAKRYTKSAAKRAGFGSRACDTIVIISGPEAAATLALSAYSGCGIRNQIKAGDGMMLVDLGGGTADTTTYLITETDPEVKFRELIVGEGGKVGSTAVNRSFDQWCKAKFGDAYGSVSPQKKGPGSSFMNEFEDIKHAFVGQGGPEDEYEVSLHMPEQDDCVNYSSYDHKVLFTSGDLQGFFEPSVSKIAKIVKSQVSKARVAMPDNRAIELCIFVGGYSESPYLQTILQQKCEKLSLKARFPHEPQSAIVKGAVLRGLGGIRPDSRCCRRHYGFAIAKPFRDGVDPEYLSFIHDYHQQTFCRGRMCWIMEKGDTVSQFTTIEKDIEWLYHEESGHLRPTYMLYGCSNDVACKYVTYNGVEQVGEMVVDFTGVDLQLFPAKYIDGERVRKVNFNLEVSLGHEEGLLRVRALVHDREIAKVSFNFDDIEASLTDTTPTLLAPGAPKRRTPTASRSGSFLQVKPKEVTPRKRHVISGSYGIVTSTANRSTPTTPRARPGKKRKVLKMDLNEISKAEDSE